MALTPDFTSITGAIKFVSALNARSGALRNTALRTRTVGIGALGASIQAVATWADRTEGTLVFDPGAASADVDYLAAAFADDLTLIAAALAKDIRLSSTRQDYFMLAMAAARKALTLRNAKQFLSESRCHILCPRHPYLGRSEDQQINFDLNSSFFRIRDGDVIDSIRGLDEPKSMLYRILEQTFQRMQIDREFREGPRFYNILKAVFELFENANVWGLAPLAGIHASSNVRGVYARYHPVRGESDKFAADKRLDAYLTQFTARPEIKLQGFLELTIYDGGPGLAAMMHHAPMNSKVSLRDEYRLVMSCLKLRGTSSDSLNRGKGLHVVFTKLSELRAFLFLQSGRLALYRDFWQHPFDDNSGSAYQMPLFFDGGAPLATTAPVVGSLFVIVIPITSTSNEQASLTF